MTAAQHFDLIDVDAYLAQEAEAETKHEYVGGVVYAMAGAKNKHNIIATNALVSLGSQLRGKTCRPFNSDTKVRIRMPAQVRFYYPDAMVVCRPNPDDDVFQDEPVVIVEVISASTRRTDEGEKKEAYLTIPSLMNYLIVETDSPTVVAHSRRSQGFERSVFAGLDAVIPLPEIDVTLSLQELFEGVS